jgi:hypothetical protein
VKRGFLFALLALLALLVASSTTAAATAGSGAKAQAAKKSKKKGCKKKGKGKASAATSAKKKSCKGKGKKPAGAPKQEGAGTPPAAPAAPWPPVDGTYLDTAGSGVELKLSGNSSSASIITGSLTSFCIPGFPTKPQPTTVTATTLSAGGEDKGTTVGSNFTVKWNIVVASNLSFTLSADTKIIEGGPIPPCDKPGTVVKGTFYKIG